MLAFGLKGTGWKAGRAFISALFLLLGLLGPLLLRLIMLLNATLTGILPMVQYTHSTSPALPPHLKITLQRWRRNRKERGMEQHEEAQPPQHQEEAESPLLRTPTQSLLHAASIGELPYLQQHLEAPKQKKGGKTSEGNSASPPPSLPPSRPPPSLSPLLAAAAAHGHEACVTYLLGRGASVEDGDEDGTSLLPSLPPSLSPSLSPSILPSLPPSGCAPLFFSVIIFPPSLPFPLLSPSLPSSLPQAAPLFTWPAKPGRKGS